MLKLLIITIILINYSQQAEFNQNSNCYAWINGTLFFDLSPIQQKQGNNDYQNLQWNVCEYVNDIANISETFAVFDEKQITGNRIDSFQLQDSNNQDGGIILNFAPYSGNNFKINIQCDKGENLIQNSYDENSQTLLINSQVGCPKISLSALWPFFQKNKNWLCIFVVVFGLLLCFFGYKIQAELTVFIIAFLLVFFIVLIFFSGVVVKFNSPDWLNWLALSISAACGLILGFIAQKIEKLGFFVVGALGGGLLGMYLYTTVLHYISATELMLYLVSGALAFVGGLLGLWLNKVISVVATSFIGSYLLNWFVGIWAGGFPNVLTLTQYINSGSYEFPYTYYIYAATILGMWIGGIFFQKRQLNGPGSNTIEQPLLGYK